MPPIAFLLALWQSNVQVYAGSSITRARYDRYGFHQALGITLLLLNQLLQLIT